MELIHTCYRITDIDRSVAFYTALGFEERRRMPIREEAINVFMGLPGAGDQLELTYNFGVDSYEIGTGYGHIALTVDDMNGTLEQLAGAGHRARAAAVPAPRGRLLPLLRPRPGRLPDRADRARRQLELHLATGLAVRLHLLPAATVEGGRITHAVARGWVEGDRAGDPFEVGGLPDRARELRPVDHKVARTFFDTCCRRSSRSVAASK